MLRSYTATIVATALSLAQLGCIAEPSDELLTDDTETTSTESDALTGTQAVRIDRAAMFTMSKYGMTSNNYQFQISLANLAYSKSVGIWAQGADGNWFEIPASYERSAGSGQEIWTANSSTSLQRFAVRYSVAGQTYWDNNGGSNYTVTGQGQNLYRGLNVLAARPDPFYTWTSTYSVRAYVRNLAYSKQVNVTYTTNGWQTVQSAPLAHQSYEYYGYGGAPSPNEAGIELWEAMIDVGNASTLEYAISYTVNGQTYWDNNHGANYRVTR